MLSRKLLHCLDKLCVCLQNICNLLQKYYVPLRNFVFACKNTTTFPLHIIYITKLLFEKVCIRSQNTCILLQNYCVSPSKFPFSCKHFAKVLRSRTLCSLAKHVRSLLKILHSPEKLCVCLQKVRSLAKLSHSPENLCIRLQLHQNLVFPHTLYYFHQKSFASERKISWQKAFARENYM